MWTIHHCPNSFSTHVLNVWTAIHQRLGSSGIIQPQKVQKFFPGVERTSRLAPARGQALQWNYPSSGIHKSLQTLPFASWKCRMHFKFTRLSCSTGDFNKNWGLKHIDFPILDDSTTRNLGISLPQALIIAAREHDLEASGWCQGDAPRDTSSDFFDVDPYEAMDIALYV